MKIAVTDACIFIDLIELKIISDFFKLEIELHTTTDVVNELFPEQKEILKAYEAGGKLAIHNLNEVQLRKIETIGFPKGLSPEDRTVLYMASQLQNALVLSSDKKVREFAGKLSIEYHGIFWIFDEMVNGQILMKEVGAAKIKELLDMNMMYRHPKTKKEAEKRIDRWK